MEKQWVIGNHTAKFNSANKYPPMLKHSNDTIAYVEHKAWEIQLKKRELE